MFNKLIQITFLSLCISCGTLTSAEANNCGSCRIMYENCVMKSVEACLKTKSSAPQILQKLTDEKKKNSCKKAAEGDCTHKIYLNYNNPQCALCIGK